MISKLSIMAFPQKQEGNSLYLNVLVIVRNFNPRIDDAINGLSPAWVNSKLRVRAMVIDSLAAYPRLDLTATPYDLPGVSIPGDADAVFKSLESRFTIKRKDRSDNTRVMQVQKYLPQTYRQAFNFIAPRNKNICVTGDQYHCAVKKNPDPDPAFVQNTDDTSWGKVFAYCLRHPELANKCGFVFTNLKIDLAADTYKNGGWLYVDLHPECSYYAATQADQTYTKRYAARIPALDLTKRRNLFAAVEFPVLIDNGIPQPDYPVAPSTSILDEMFIEAAEYDDGFCKIVHNYQPVSNHLLLEEQDDEYPVTNDIGIRMGWDDEQLAAWHARQLGADPVTGKRPDAPLGVLQYRVDVRKKSADPHHPAPWTSLCRVAYNQPISFDATPIAVRGDEFEMGVEVYPSQLDADKTGSFWLPSYFSQWIGKSLVLQDEDAIAIYQKDKIDKNHLGVTNQYDPPGEKAFKATPNTFYDATGLSEMQLLYGRQYEFRVRMSDTTGGGPTKDDEPVYAGVSPIGSCHFLRHVIPQTLNFTTPIPATDTAIFSGNTLSVKRPLLGYPSVLFTGGYTDAVQKLIDDGNTIISSGGKIKRDIGLYDPDVDRMEILVEIRSLGMDTTIRKEDPKDAYALLYTTTRAFPGGLDLQLDVPLTFIDAPVLNFSDPLTQELPDLGLNPSGKTNIDDRTDIVLPTARDIRITVRALTQNQAGYYGGTNPEDGKARTELKGMTSSFITRMAATSELNLFKPTGDQMMIRGIYLQPDPPFAVTADISQLLVANLAGNNQVPDMIQRLSSAIGSESRGMSLIGKQGQRWQFGVSRYIRHSAAPDNTSITFATKDDLLNHWVIPITLLIDRDWTWDGAKIISVQVYRRTRFLRDAMKDMGLTDRDKFLKNSASGIMTNAAVKAAAPEELVGDIEWKRAINIQALVQPDRSQTYCCFVDAAEPKQTDETKFPDEIFVSYRIAVNYLTEGSVVPKHDDDLLLYLHLPVTTQPAQLPKIVSAGMAFSKYMRDRDYANTETRQRYLWVEFDKAPADPDDMFFARMLAYAPDTLLANWEPDLLIAPLEPALPVDPEPIRIISSVSSDDKTGLDAMQEMVPAEDSDVHYLVPLPPGLHTDGPELFGFFTYEFRVGHKIPWSTAQGRFGRALRNTGVQHPVPQLYCVPNRNEEYISVAAPYAQTVFNGRNVTARPPRTEIWALLYAQVTMADDSDERNVLLSDRKLVIPHPSKYHKGGFSNINTNSDAVPQGVTVWTNYEVEKLLALYGLPLDSSLSVLCVEMMPGYDNFFANQQYYEAGTTVHENSDQQAATPMVNADAFRNMVHASNQAINKTREYAHTNEQRLQTEKQPESYLYQSIASIDNSGPRPLSADLGNYRILRTSLLAAVPAVCCTNC